jgi:hypothetical protein
MTNYPHTFQPGNKFQSPTPQTALPSQKKILTMEEKIDKIFFRTATIEKDVAALLRSAGLDSSNKFLNQTQ